jgi:hypothetical protein
VGEFKCRLQSSAIRHIDGGVIMADIYIDEQTGEQIQVDPSTGKVQLQAPYSPAIAIYNGKHISFVQADLANPNKQTVPHKVHK